jgi:ribulose kinase
MKIPTTFKILGSLAIVGTIAAIAFVNSDAISNSMLSSSATFLAQEDASNAQDQREFQQFLNKHNKNYLTKDEYKARLQVFKSNLKFIKAHKDGDEGYSLGVNNFADMSPEEY